MVGVRATDTVLGVLVRLLGARTGRRRHSRHRTLTRVLAALAIVAGLLALSPAQPAGAADDDKVTFTVGLKNEVDSFNPFLGYEAPSYEMWALTYDYMVGYSMDDMSPVPGAGEVLGDLGGRPDVDLRHPRGREVVGRRAVHGRRHRLHLQPGPQRGDRGGSVRVLPDDRRDGHGAGRHDGGAEAQEAQRRRCRCCRSRSSRSTSGRTSARRRSATYPAEPSEGKPVVGTGPFRLVEGKAGGSTYRFETNPDYWGGEPHVDEVVFRVFKAEDPMVQALIKGEVDFIHDITPSAGQGAGGPRGHQGVQRRLAVLRGARVQHRGGRHRDRQADR